MDKKGLSGASWVWIIVLVMTVIWSIFIKYLIHFVAPLSMFSGPVTAGVLRGDRARFQVSNLLRTF